MIIKVLGSGCTNCTRLEKAARDAVAQLGIEATVEKVTDLGDIVSYGIMTTPALVVDENVKSAGRVLTTEEIVRILERSSQGDVCD